MASFQPNCTLPTERGAFVVAPNVRSAIEIIWSCFAITVLCTWSIIRINVPPHVIPQTSSQWVRWHAHLFRRKVLAFLTMLFAPEIIIGKAIVEWEYVSYSTLLLQKIADAEGVPWSRQHTVFLEMGGLAIRFLDDGESTEENRSTAATRRGRPAEALDRYADELSQRLRKFGMPLWKRHPHNYKMALQYGPVSDHTGRFLNPSQGNIWTLDSLQMVAAHEAGLFKDSGFPKILAEDIQARDKSDGLFKAIAVLQVLWMAMQVVTRHTMGLPSSQLEISTLALAAISILVYGLQWSRPKDISVPLYFDMKSARNVVTEDLMRHFVTVKDTIDVPARAAYTIPTTEFGSRLYDNGARAGGRCMPMAIILGGIIFGGVHLAAWNFSYPTLAEQVMWRVSSIYLMLGPLLSIILASFLVRVLSEFGMRKVLTPCLGVAYVAARLALLVGSLRSLWFLPPEAFVSTWAGNAPHFG